MVTLPYLRKRAPRAWKPLNCRCSKPSPKLGFCMTSNSARALSSSSREATAEIYTLAPLELPLLKPISEARVLHDVEFRAGAVLQQPRSDGRDLSVLVEVPLHGLQAKPDAAGFNVHFSVAALVKDAKGEVAGSKLTRDRSVHVPADQLKMGNVVDKMAIELPPGKYTLETAVMDRESGNMGTGHSEFSVAPTAKGVGISSLTSVRSYTPNVKGLDPKIGRA